MDQRVLTPELMDDAAIDPREHRRALRGLARLNRLSRAHVSVARAVADLLRERSLPASDAILLDLAAGGGDLLLGVRDVIGRCACRGAADVAADISPTALEVAQGHARARGHTVRTLRADVLAAPLPIDDSAVDVGVCSLFLHHLMPVDVVRVLAELARVSRVGVVVSDLARSRLGLAMAFCAGRIVTRSRVVHVDSIKSVRAAFTREELAEFAFRAGMKDAIIREVWPERLLLTWRRA
ncbi:MAG: methyltransferase domain-containing protein [Phycisphaerales bacterium]|jgi:ubiquinone/menaquinone biosynthesis C-methylase UbiE|nr:methyltransferase domain-containing protein [Phycisphaeraceae bacterium]